MTAPKKSNIKKYVTIIKSSKDKYITVDDLSRMIGIYQDIIQNDLSYFDPMIKIDTNFDILTILSDLQKYIKIDKKQPKKTNNIKKDNKLDREASKFQSVQDFVYKKMSLGGLIDRSSVLNDEDLKILKKLIIEEQNKRKQAKHKFHK